jgi:antitoxin CcdA
LNLSALVERALEEAIRDKQQEAWLTENRDAIQAYNAQVERRGVFSEGRRRF